MDIEHQKVPMAPRANRYCSLVEDPNWHETQGIFKAEGYAPPSGGASERASQTDVPTCNRIVGIAFTA